MSIFLDHEPLGLLPSSALAEGGGPLSQPVFTPTSIFNGRGRGSLIDFLASGTGLNVETFDQESLKSLEELQEEHAGRDIVLARDTNGYIHRLAKSSKVQLLVPSAGLWYRETGRTFLRPGVHILHNPPRWEGISETGKHGEIPLASAMNGIAEELGWRVPTDNLVCVTEGKSIVHRTWSSVYEGIISQTIITRFRLELEEPLWRGKKKIIKDGNIQVHIGTFPYDPD